MDIHMEMNSHNVYRGGLSPITQFIKNSSRLKFNSHNVCQGGLNPNPFAGISPPQYTLYKLIFARLLLFCENQQTPILTRVSGLQTEKYPRKRHPLTQVG